MSDVTGKFDLCAEDRRSVESYPDPQPGLQGLHAVTQTQELGTG